jgi:hypothetical protein
LDAAPESDCRDTYEQDDDVAISRRVIGPDRRQFLNAVRLAEEERNVESVLQLVKDDRKRLAFRLYMEGVPHKSSRSHSIAEALGIDEKTARQWVKEVQSFLKAKLGGKL